MTLKDNLFNLLPTGKRYKSTVTAAVPPDYKQLLSSG